jgi:hypothetical protein
VAKIWVQYNACPNFQWESHTTHGFWNSSLLCYLMNCQMTIGMNHFLNFLDVFFILRCRRFPEHSRSSTEVWPSWKCLYHSWVCVLLMALSPNTCINILKVSKKFSLIWNKISHKHNAHKNNPLLITNKFAKPARHIYTMTKQTKTIRFVVFA